MEIEKSVMDLEHFGLGWIHHAQEHDRLCPLCNRIILLNTAPKEAGSPNSNLPVKYMYIPMSAKYGVQPRHPARVISDEEFDNPKNHKWMLSQDACIIGEYVYIRLPTSITFEPRIIEHRIDEFQAAIATLNTSDRRIAENARICLKSRRRSYAAKIRRLKPRHVKQQTDVSIVF